MNEIPTYIRLIMTRTRLLFLATCVAMACGQVSVASAEQDEAFKVTTITCWDLTGLENQEQTAAFLLVYGYVAGSQGHDEQTGAKISGVSERVTRLCSGNPDMYVSSAVARALGS